MKKRNLIGSNLKRIRKLQGLSQEQCVAKLHLLGLDLDRTSFSRIETHIREVYDYELLYLSKILNVSILEFYKDVKF